MGSHLSRTVAQGRAFMQIVDGKPVDSLSGERIDVVSPSDGEVFASIPASGTADVDRVVKAARRAFDEGPWGRMQAVERGRCLTRLFHFVKKRGEELARWNRATRASLFGRERRMSSQPCATTSSTVARATKSMETRSRSWMVIRRLRRASRMASLPASSLGTIRFRSLRACRCGPCRQHRVAKRVRAGQVFINSYGAGAGIELPFGGFKRSGHGREKGFEALYDMSATKTIVFNHG